MTGFRSRSFENNWNIYKLLAHQKVSKEKVRWCERQTHGCCLCSRLARPLPQGCLWGRPAAPAQEAGSSERPSWAGDPASCLGSEL